MKNIFTFFDGACDTQDKKVVGNKAANLMQLKREGIPVPEGFVLPTHLTFDMPLNGFESNSDTMIRAKAVVRFAADMVDREWGNKSKNPYLVSVRSGAAVSMPGMMDTILNVGLTRDNLDNLPGGRVFALDCYRRLIQMFATTVFGDGIPDDAGNQFRAIYDDAKKFFIDIDETMLEVVVENYEARYTDLVGEEFTQDVDRQLALAINAVYGSWQSERAIAYRDHAGISHDLGTAVTIQGMRFGNFNERSGTGVVFSRDPNTGENNFYGDFLLCAQGEDVVAGTHNTISMGTSEFGQITDQPHFAKAFYELMEHAETLDSKFGCAVDIEYTIEDGKLWVLQCRAAKLGAKARALQLLSQYINDTDAAHVLAELQDILGSQSTAASTTAKLAFTGQGVSSGVAMGFLATTAEAVAEYKARGEAYIFAAQDTSPDDTPQMLGAAGLLTANGSSTCHAAVCARAWDTPAVVGAGFIMVGNDTTTGITHDGSLVINNGDLVTINGDTGEVSVG